MQIDARKGYVAASDSSAMQPVPDTNAMFRAPIDRGVGCQNLTQRVFRYEPGTSTMMANAISEDVLYVVEGQGQALVDGKAHPLTPGTGLYVPPGSQYQFVNPGPDHLLIVSVLSPQPGQAVGQQADAHLRSDGKLTTNEADEAPIPAGDRTFKYIINHRFGCRNVTQFVGFIPPGKAPFHTHTYEEVIYIIEGQGVAHVEDHDHPISTGSSVYLPPQIRHCLENTGQTPIRLLGVFCPAGDPSSKVSEESGDKK